MSDLDPRLSELLSEATPDDGKLVPVIVRMPPSLHQAIKAQAAKDDRTMAQSIRRAIRFYLAQRIAELEAQLAPKPHVHRYPNGPNGQGFPENQCIECLEWK